MLLTIMLYLAAIVVLAVVAPLLSILTSFVLLPLARAYRSLAPVVLGAQSAIAVGLAMAMFVWLCNAVGRQASEWMFALPFLLMTSNDIGRIRRAADDGGPARAALEREGDAYDAAAVTAQEIGMFVGALVGMTVVFIRTFG